MAFAPHLARMLPGAGTRPASPIDSRLPSFSGQSWCPPLKTDVRCRVLEIVEPAAWPDVDDSRHQAVVEEASRPSIVKRVQKEVKLLQRILGTVNGVKERVLTDVAHLLFKEAEFSVNHFAGNWAPVAEIGKKTAVRVVSGAIPTDFPPGVYIRNGPNPQFGGKGMSSPFGLLEYHPFEADGMLHATYFEEGGKASYLNRYVSTECYELEKERGGPVWLTSFHGDAGAIALSHFFNLMRFFKVTKPTCNTNVFQHAGRYFAIAEGDFPHEFNLSDLTTVAPWDGCKGQWTRRVTAHPLRDPETKELVIFGFSPFKPYCQLAVWSADGERLVRKIDLELDHCVFCHELAITRRYTIFFDFPLVINVCRLLRGGSLVEFEENSASRVGILPRYGDSKSTKWFPVEAGHSWHKVNSFEDGDEVVVIGIRSRRSIIPLPKEADRKEWWARGLQNVDPKHAPDPSMDGALAGYVHEWRFNMVTGDVSERDLSGYSFSGECPTINRSYTGVKNKYGYMNVYNTENAREYTGVPPMVRWAKLTLPQSAKEELKVEFHDLGTGWGVSELSFVSRPNPRAEDDGWLVAYVHDEEAGISYFYIIDAQNFSGEPVAKLQLPQRVPYGYHGTYFYEEEPEHVLARSKTSH